MKAFPSPPQIKTAFPEWPVESITAWQRLTERAASISERAGRGRAFESATLYVRNLLETEDISSVHRLAADRRFLRALATVWSEDDELARRTMPLIDLSVLSAGASRSRLATIVFAKVFLKYFTAFDEWRQGLFEQLRDLLGASVKHQQVRQVADTVEALRRFEHILLERDGPVVLARELLRDGLDNRTWLRQNGLALHENSRFGYEVRDRYFLTAIEELDPESGDHSLLRNVCADHLIRQPSLSPALQDGYFGHDVLGALTAKETLRPSRYWLDAILSIGGDPRLKPLPQQEDWWARVPVTNRDRAIRWMQGQDLRAFLDGIEEYAHAIDNDGMIRMLERRKLFLLGLYDQGRINDVRLVLGDEIRKRIAAKAKVPLVEVAKLKGSTKETAVIYIDAGDFWLIEGSHNFPLHIYLYQAPEQIGDRRVRTVYADDIRNVYPDQHIKRHGEDSHRALRHDSLVWLISAIGFLEDNGIELNERALMSPQDYAGFLRRRDEIV